MCVCAGGTEDMVYTPGSPSEGTGTRGGGPPDTGVDTGTGVWWPKSKKKRCIIYEIEQR